MSHKPALLLDPEKCRVVDVRNLPPETENPCASDAKRLGDRWIPLSLAETPVWTEPALLAVFEENDFQQFVILTDRLPLSVQHLCFMALERGYRVHLVLQDTTIDAIQLSRLSQAGVVVMTLDIFTEEINLSET